MRNLSKALFSRCGRAVAALVFVLQISATAQSIRVPWSSYSHDPQHDGLASVPSQALNRIIWQTPVDLSVPADNENELYIHYGSPLVTRSNTVIVPVKTGVYGGFEVMAVAGATGATNWIQTSDYTQPPSHGWTLSFSPALTPLNRLCFSGAGGTVYYCNTPDAASAPMFGQWAFYGLTNYAANSNAYVSSVYICTPITSDRYGNIFFGFQVTGPNPLNLQSGVARIDQNGTGTWVAATNLAPGGSANKPAFNCSPALANDQKTLYLAINNSSTGYGYLVSLDSRSLAPLTSVLLTDVHYPTYDASINDDGTSSPTVGPDGDVYYGVLENPSESNNLRGWLLHFNSTLTQSKLPGAFGWDDTASVVPASMVPSYQGASKYLLMTKYNNYVEGGGNGVNKIAILDPNQSEKDPISGQTVMNEVLTIAGPTPDPENQSPAHPNAVREWCINSAAVDPFTKSVLANNEDGHIYRWNLVSNTLSQTNTLTAGVGEAYTPTVVGVNGYVYAINNAILFALGQ